MSTFKKFLNSCEWAVRLVLTFQQHFLNCTTVRKPKFLHLTASSGKTCIHHVSIDSFTQSIVVWACKKQTEAPHPPQSNACFDVLDVQPLSWDTFKLHFNVHLYTFRLWNSFDLRCESGTFNYFTPQNKEFQRMTCHAYLNTGKHLNVHRCTLKCIQGKWLHF